MFFIDKIDFYRFDEILELVELNLTRSKNIQFKKLATFLILYFFKNGNNNEINSHYYFDINSHYY